METVVGYRIQGRGYHYSIPTVCNVNAANKILFPGTSGLISMKVDMKHQRFNLIIFYSNDNPVLILTYVTARSNFATSTFIWENVRIMDTLEIIASGNLDFGLYAN